MTKGEQIVENLLKPRYKVIADYPFSKDRIGDILELVVDRNDVWDNCRTGKRQAVIPPAYPAIFKPLAWWEEREASEMPEYVNHFGNIYKIADANEKYPDCFVIDYPNTEAWIYYEDCTPATEADYNQYIKSQANK